MFPQVVDWPLLHESFAQLGLGPLVEYIFPVDMCSTVTESVHSMAGPNVTEAGRIGCDDGQAVAGQSGPGSSMAEAGSSDGQVVAGQSGDGTAMTEALQIESDDRHNVAGNRGVGPSGAEDAEAEADLYMPG